MPTEPAADLCLAPVDTVAYKHCFERDGYVALRNALPPAVCAEAVDGFLEEVHLDTRALFLRAAPDRYAPHAYTETGRMRFPIINLQDISGRRYPQFKAAGLALLTDPALRQAVEILLGEPARLLRTMYSDGVPGASMQCDADTVVGAWIAAEDAGCRDAPPLRQGDLLLWNATASRAGWPAAVAACPQRAFIGYYGGRARRLPHGGVTLGGVEIMLHDGTHSLSGRAAAMLRSASPRLYSFLRGYLA